MVTLLCSFESGILMTTLQNKFCKQKKCLLFFFFSGNIQSHFYGPLSLDLGNQVNDSRGNFRFLLVIQYLTQGNVNESGSFVNKRSILPGA